MISAVLPYRIILPFLIAGVLLLIPGSVLASPKKKVVTADVVPALHNLLDMATDPAGTGFDVRTLDAFMPFFLSDKAADTIYHADGSFGAPSAYHEFSVDTDLQHLIEYTMDADIPSFFFWPSSLRLTRWSEVVGGATQFDRLKAAAADLDIPFIFKGMEHMTITPDQHTGAYYSYDVDKMVILTPYRGGKAMISIYRQKKPSEVGKKGWVLGSDDEWSYLYTQDTGLNVGGLGWANTYMYDSFGVTVYFQPDPQTPLVRCGVFSWVKAGWAGINMVQPKHIHRGLVRVATAFKAILEDPRLPEPAILAETFSKSENLPTPKLRQYAQDYFSNLEQRLISSGAIWKKVGHAFDSQILLDQMNRDELYAVLALDYFKKILGRNSVMQSHPF